MKTLASILVLAAAAACAARTPPADEPWAEEEAAFAAQAKTSDPAAPRAEPAPATRRTSGEVARTDLVAALDRGPGSFLRAVRVRAAFTGAKFSGWEIVDVSHPSLAAVDLVPGDVIRAINGSALERPDDLHKLWLALRTAPTIRIESLRAGKPHLLTWQIIGDTPAPGNPAK